MMLLHGQDGLLFCQPFVDALAARTDLVAPVHPGWRGAPRPDHITTIDDLAYHYLDTLDQQPEPVALVGLSFGGWLAAEIAVKSTQHISSLVLVSPLGIKVGARDERDFVDLYALEPALAQQAGYADPAATPDLAELDDDDFLTLAVAQEAVARYAWSPYLHNPKLVHRLHRIDVPTLIVHGDADSLVLRADYYDRYATAIGSNASMVALPGVGHRVEEEAPDHLADLVIGHVSGGVR